MSLKCLLLCVQVCDAVRYLHEQNITHRDLMLENLLLDQGFEVKICDFGFVKKEPEGGRHLSR